MKNKIKPFTAVNAEGLKKEYVLNFNEENPTVTYEGVEYKAIMPGQMLTHESIQNPKPLPKGMYAFIIDGTIFIVAKTHIHGIVIQSLDPKWVATYKGKNASEKVMRIIFWTVAVIGVGICIWLSIDPRKL